MLMEANRDVVESSSDRQQEVIWIIEDHEDSLTLLSFILDDLCDGKVIGFSNGQAVLEYAPLVRPDLILMDIILPDISGIEIMQQFKRDPLMQHIPIVAVTALAREGDRDRLLEVGFTDYISKPYMLEDIATILVHYLKRKPPLNESGLRSR
jgi:two-component system, cell cycle response regulator DivK